MKKTGLMILVMLLVFVSSAYAATLSGTATADDAFNLYISTSDNVAGTSLLSRPNGSNDEWKTPLSFTNVALTPGTYWLHAEAWDVKQQIAGFLGDFTLTGWATFSNGNQSLLTNTANWTVSSAWGLNDLTPTLSTGAGGTGLNDGTGLWGFASPLSGISTNAAWIWSNNGMDLAPNYNQPPFLNRYFSTKITVTPEPVSAVLFGLGAGVFGLLGLRRKKA